MGRNRLSNAEHALRGTKASPVTEPEVSQVLKARPKMPSHLSPEARREWRRILPLLEERNVLSRADSTALGIYCETFARWVAAKKQISVEGITKTTQVLDRNGAIATSTKIHPALKIAENCERSLRACLREFGLTPQSREKVKPTRKTEEEEPLPPGSIGAMFPEAFR
jgi:P27 family predicted phage terminase small subunit